MKNSDLRWQNNYDKIKLKYNFADFEDSNNFNDIGNNYIYFTGMVFR